MRSDKLTTTQWEKTDVSGYVDATGKTAKYLRGTHAIWSRLLDGEHIFTVRPIGEQPGDNDGGCRSIDAALTAKGMKP